ncbi:MAG: hypothetical protein R3C18_16130 [Planctomycetaceae bacterium]
MVNLTPEQRAALQQQPDGVACEDAETHRIYFLVDSETHQQAMAALRRQRDRDAIAEGVADMEAGRFQPLDEAFADIRGRLGFPERA